MTDGWTCGNCSFDNISTDLRCQTCHTTHSSLSLLSTSAPRKMSSVPEVRAPVPTPFTRGTITCILIQSNFQTDKDLLDDLGIYCRTCKRLVSDHPIGEYRCKICTFINPMDQSCGICNALPHVNRVLQIPERKGSIELSSAPPVQKTSSFRKLPARRSSRSPPASTLTYSSLQLPETWVEADSFGLWACNLCSHKNLPLTNTCEMCLSSRMREGGEDDVSNSLLPQLAMSIPLLGRKDWSLNIANRLLNEFELVVSGKHVFRIVAIEFVFNNNNKLTSSSSLSSLSSLSPSASSSSSFTFLSTGNAGEWFYQTVGGRLGIHFSSGVVWIRAIQSGESCQCAGKNEISSANAFSNCQSCNAIVDTPSAIIDKVGAVGLTTSRLDSLREAGLRCIVENAYLYLCPVISFGREITTNFAPENVDGSGYKDMREHIRYCSLSEELAQRRLVRELSRKNVALAQISEQIGKPLSDVLNILSPRKRDEGKSPARLKSLVGAETSELLSGKVDLARLGTDTSVHTQASILHDFFTSLYQDKPTPVWSTEIANNLLFSLSRNGTKLPPAFLYGERDATIHDFVPKEQRKQLWMLLLMPLFAQDDCAIGETSAPAAALCEQCDHHRATLRCDKCGIFCEACNELWHTRGLRKTHSINPLLSPTPQAHTGSIALSPARTSLTITNLVNNAQYIASCIVFWSLTHQSIDEFISLLQEIQVNLEPLGWSEVMHEKFGGVLVMLLKKIAGNVKSFKNQILPERIDHLVALFNFLEEFCFYSPSHGFALKPSPATLGVHFNDNGSLDKELFLLAEELVDKPLVLNFSDNTNEQDEHKKRHKALLSVQALFKASVAWANVLETELCNASPTPSSRYCTGAADLVTVLMQRARFKKYGSERKQASAAFMHVAGWGGKRKSRSSRQEFYKPELVQGWGKVSIDAAITQMKAGQATLGNILNFISKEMELTRTYMSGMEKLLSSEDKRPDKMSRFEETTQFVRAVTNSQVIRHRMYLTEVMSEVITPLVALHKECERESVSLQPRVQQCKADYEASKNKLRNLRETAYKSYLELVKIYWQARDKVLAGVNSVTPEDHGHTQSKKLIAAKAACLQSFMEFEKSAGDLESLDTSRLMSDLRALELKRMSLVRAYLRRYVQATNRLTQTLPANTEMEKLLSGLDLETDLSQFAMDNPARDFLDDIQLPLKSVQLITNKWVEMLPENQDVDEGLILKEETLCTLSGRPKSWEQRHVVLRENYLCYYKTANKKILLGDIPIAGSSVYVWSPDSVLFGRKGLYFALVSPQGKVMVFQATDEKHRMHWVGLLDQQRAELAGSGDHLDVDSPVGYLLKNDPAGLSPSELSPVGNSRGDFEILDIPVERTRRSTTMSAVRGKLISRITFPDNWTIATGACQINPEDTAGSILAKMAAKHSDTPAQMYALLHEGEALDDVINLAARFGSDNVVNFTIKPRSALGKERESKDAALCIAKFSLPEDWACRTATCVLRKEDTAAAVVAKMAAKHGSTVSAVAEDYVLARDGEAVLDSTVLVSAFDKSASFSIRPKKPHTKVETAMATQSPRRATVSLHPDDSIYQPRHRTSRFSISGTDFSRALRLSLSGNPPPPEESRVELIAKVQCPVHWACSVASYSVLPGETARAVTRKLAKMYAMDGEKYALMHDDEMVDDDTILASRFKGVVNFSVLPCFGGSWF